MIKKNNKIYNLEKLISYHDYLYYSLDAPVISDFEYDVLLKQLLKLKKKYGVLYFNNNSISVGSVLSSDFKSHNHLTPMLSLNNTFNTIGYNNFHNKILKKVHSNYKIRFFCELKFDGLALSLIYKNGKLIRALTRGNGIIGEDVIQHVFIVKNIPLVLCGNDIPEVLEVRGEVCMLKKDFEKLNSELHKNKKKKFSNTRNAASGSLRNKNFLFFKKRTLFFFCYHCSFITGNKYIKLHSDQLKVLNSWGFVISQYVLLTDCINKILNFYHLILKLRKFLSFNIDGIVIKLDSIKLQKKIGFTNKFPKWAIAFKFLAQEVCTKLICVNFQVSRTGIIIPVACLKPVVLLGVVIKKSSLYNKNIMDKLDLHINDTVVVRRVGDVIPKICSVIVQNRKNNSSRIYFPNYCPSCNSLLLTCNNSKIVQCLAGNNCLSQRQKIIEHFFSKNALYAEGFGTNIISSLVKNKIVKNVLDCFALNTIALSKIKFMGYKLSQKIIRSIKNCKNTYLSNFIYALGIENIGLESSILIANYFCSLENIFNSTIDDLKNIKNFGKINTTIFFNFINDIKNINYIKKLISQCKITFIENKSVNINKKNYFFNKKIVITGKFYKFNRVRIIRCISQLGGKVCSVVSKKIDFLILGKKPGKKLLKAIQLRIKIIQENEVYDLLC